MSTTATPHHVRWFVYTSTGERIPRAASMRGQWPGYDAVCSCGWDSRTGGGLRRWVAELVAKHKQSASRAHKQSATATQLEGLTAAYVQAFTARSEDHRNRALVSLVQARRGMNTDDIKRCEHNAARMSVK